MHFPPPHRLRLDGDALVANWRTLARMGGDAACGAAVKADGYGLGAREVVRRLARAGARDMFVSTWAEAAALAPLPDGISVSVLHGVRAEDMQAATRLPHKPVLNTPDQVRRWRDGGGGRPCDVMIDTGMNRLGLAPDAPLDGLAVDVLMSHLGCADEDLPMSARQRETLRGVAARVPHRRLSLANSAGTCLGPDYAFDLTRPGLALYGGVPRAEAAGRIAQVAFPEAQILQRRTVRAGESVGYNATWTAGQDTAIAILNIGYADGLLRALSGRARALADEAVLPFVGRVSMDLIAIDVSAAPLLAEGDWVTIDYDLPRTAALTGLSQYELLTGLGARLERVWV